MIAAAKTHDSAATGQRFIAAIAHRAWDELATLSSEIQPMHDRLHISYRFRAHKDQWYLIEQQAYCSVQDGQIKQIDLVCSGFRPEVAPPSGWAPGASPGGTGSRGQFRHDGSSGMTAAASSRPASL